jgi:signal transduction histidine kinase
MSETRSRILIVDDDEASRYVKAHLLRQHGHSVFEAATGRAALAIAAAETPDLALLDVVLPDLSGIEVCRDIKSRFPNIVVLQTSATFTGVGDRTRALAGGADAYLVEPIEPAELVATVSALLRMRSAEREVRRINRDLERLVAERTQELAETNRRLAEEIAERRKAEAVLLHTQKLDLMGRLAGNIAHDFNNLLTIISGNVALAQQAIKDDAERGSGWWARLVRLLGTIESAADAAAKMTRQLLVFARPSGFTSEPCSLGDLLRDMENFVRRSAGEAIKVSFACAADLWRCRIDPAQAEAAILNLVVNARDAMPGGGKLRIRLANVSAGSETGSSEHAVPAGDYVRIIVSDTGCGMTPEVVEHVFEPFFTTKEVGKGSGLGLAQVYGFVKQCGGHVCLSTAPDRGTAVSLYLPRASEPRSAAVPPTGAHAGDLQGGNETVLVVEDNTNVRDVATAMITSLGYRALSAADAKEALMILHEAPRIDLLMSDVVMAGGIDGFELARRARAKYPDLPVLLVSGYPRDGAAAADDFPILRKPYRREELAQWIRAGLDAQSAAPERSFRSSS